MANKFEKRNLYKLILARSDITNALFTCRYFMENVKDIKNPLWLSLQEAVIVSYARPFSKNRPLGSLGKAWNKMPNTNMQETHNRVLETRDKQIAHSDIEENKVFIIPKGLGLPPDYHPFAEVGIEIATSKFSISFFEKVEKNCLFLGRSLHPEIQIQLNKLYGNLQSEEKVKLDIEKDD